MKPTSIRELFEIELPIIQAPMAGAQDSRLTIAVSAAGGLGSLPCAMLDADGLREAVATIRDRCNRPFNLNFFCHQPAQPDPARQQAWLDLLAPYYVETGADPARISRGVTRKPFDAEIAAVVGELRPPVVSFHFGLPEPELLRVVRACGAKILSSATTVEEARWLEQRGVDAIIAQGLEAGGHRGMFLTDDLSTQLGTFALVPQIVRAVRVPVIAAGGIANAAGVRAAMALGAAGVQIGTSYLLCPEAHSSPVHRAALCGPEAAHTALTTLFTGRPARGIVNRLMRELGSLNPAAPAFPLAGAALAPLREIMEARARADFSAMWAGQNVSGCKLLEAGELTRELAGDTAEN